MENKIKHSVHLIALIADMLIKYDGYKFLF